jgi:disulfide bond formation protein DsbB
MELQNLSPARSGAGLAAAASAAALALALIAQYGFALEPCQLCIWQRYAYGAALALGLIGLFWPGAARAFLALAGLAFLAGAGIASFHVGVEQQWWEGLPGCSSATLQPGMSIEELRAAIEGREAVVACDEVPWSLFGISMAGYNVLASLLFAGLAFWLVGRAGRRSLA